MTHLKWERTTRCSPDVAGARIREFFASLGSGETVHLRLSARAHFLGLELPVRRDVMARLSDYSDNDHIVEVEWNPGSALLPTFNGIISVAPEGNDACRMMLNGIYRPPMGPLGSLFDRIIGLRLAKTTASELLDKIGRSLERSDRSSD